MGYILSEESQKLVAMVRDFCDKEIVKQCKEFDISGAFPAEIMKKCNEMQLNLIELPKKYGGPGLDWITIAAIYEELGRADAGVASTLATNTMLMKVLFKFGTEEQAANYCELLKRGGYSTFALTEAQAGSDAANTLTVADKDGDDYVLNGAKAFASNGGIADVHGIFALTDKTAGTKGLTAFLVEKERAGMKVGQEENKMGIRLSNTTSLFLENVRVPASNVIGQEGKGFSMAMQTLDAQRIVTAAITIGIAQRGLEEAAAYAKQRVTFGQPINRNQAVQFMLADMDIKIETARQMIVHAFTLLQNGTRCTREASIAKCYTADIAMEVATDAVQIVGGYGYSRDYPVEKLMRDAKVFQILEGTNQIQRMIIGGQFLR
ncbi:MAG: acyl-CoA dehydrogenase family protein [Clostridiales Family XIII bacterium]|jgi:butyryl-CoA dehydrogenase|nr:acyl-CoA dehydrogenase family protein [Clostridiales Family XIII bacterium]